MERRVSQFIFSFRSSEESPEIDRFELPDNGAACRQALQACSDFLRDIEGIAHDPAEWEIEVRREDGSPVAVIRFCMKGFVRE